MANHTAPCQSSKHYVTHAKAIDLIDWTVDDQAYWDTLQFWDIRGLIRKLLGTMLSALFCIFLAGQVL